MKTNMKGYTARTLVFALGLLLSAAAGAHGGFHGGGFHGGGWHGGGWHGGGWHGGGWHGGGWGGGGWGGGGWGGVGLVGIPFGGYYAPACRTVRVCNYHGHCWLQRSCY